MVKINPLSKWFWEYILYKRSNYYGDVGWLKTIWCRITNHKCGIVWYNPNGFEPDMHCKRCGDNLG